MNIIVTIKQVPDTNDVRIDPATGTLIREGVPSIVNPEDRHALEAAIALREQAGGGKVTVLSMGPPQAEAALREALAMGADAAVLLSDRAFAGADTLATACALQHAVRKLGAVDLILCGRQAIDGDTAQVGPQLAEFLGLPQITYVKQLRLEGGQLVAERHTEAGTQVVACPLPAVVTCLKELNQPRIPTLHGCLAAFREKPYTVWSAADIGAPPAMIGLNGSPTQVRRTFTPEPRGAVKMLAGSPREAVAQLVAALAGRNLVG